MILKIELENFFSIKDRIRIDFRAASINTAQARELSYNVMRWKGVPVLKSVGLFRSQCVRQVEHPESNLVLLQDDTGVTPTQRRRDFQF